MSVGSYGPGAPDAFGRRVDAQIFGHFLDVLISRPGTAEAVRVRGLIDTGASDVCIDYRIAQELGLREVDQRDVGVVGATTLATVYTGVIRLPELGYQNTLPLYALKVRRPTHDVLIGRSLLKEFIVTFNGPSGTFHFATPMASYDEHPFEE